MSLFSKLVKMKSHLKYDSTFAVNYAFPFIMVLTIPTIADFDLTGQLVWPGAMLLNDYISKNAELLQGCSVMELGSGVGMYSCKRMFLSLKALYTKY